MNFNICIHCVYALFEKVAKNSLLSSKREKDQLVHFSVVFFLASFTVCWMRFEIGNVRDAWGEGG